MNVDSELPDQCSIGVRVEATVMSSKHAPCLDCWAVVDIGGAMCLTGELEPAFLQTSTSPVVAARALPSCEILVDTVNGDSYILGEPSQLFLARYPTGAQRIYDLVGKELT